MQNVPKIKIHALKRTFVVGLLVFISSAGVGSQSVSLIECRSALATASIDMKAAKETAGAIVGGYAVPFSESAELAKIFTSRIILRALATELKSRGYKSVEKIQLFLRLLTDGASSNEQIIFATSVIERLGTAFEADRGNVLAHGELAAREKRVASLGFDLITYAKIIHSFQGQAESDFLIPKLAVIELLRQSNTRRLAEALYKEMGYWTLLRRFSIKKESPSLETSDGVMLTDDQTRSFKRDLNSLVKASRNALETLPLEAEAYRQLEFFTKNLSLHISAKQFILLAEAFRVLSDHRLIKYPDVIASMREASKSIVFSFKERLSLQRALLWWKNEVLLLDDESVSWGKRIGPQGFLTAADEKDFVRQLDLIRKIKRKVKNAERLEQILLRYLNYFSESLAGHLTVEQLLSLADKFARLADREFFSGTEKELLPRGILLERFRDASKSVKLRPFDIRMLRYSLSEVKWVGGQQVMFYPNEDWAKWGREINAKDLIQTKETGLPGDSS